jgi:hypothetical protein
VVGEHERHEQHVLLHHVGHLLVIDDIDDEWRRLNEGEPVPAVNGCARGLLLSLAVWVFAVAVIVLALVVL